MLNTPQNAIRWLALFLQCGVVPIINCLAVAVAAWQSDAAICAGYRMKRFSALTSFARQFLVEARTCRCVATDASVLND